MNKQENCLVSIIVPTYNSEITIIHCLTSIVDQTYPFKEIIIIDGASTDRTLEIVRSFQEKYSYIKWVSEKDNGVYDAMNKGIDLAAGEFLFFMGSDDAFYNDSVLERVSSYFAFDFIYGNVLFKYSKRIYSGESSLEKLIGQQVSICHQAIFYRKTIFELVGKYDLKYFVHADYDLNVKCFEHPEIKIRYVDMIITLYNECGISGQHPNKDAFHDHLTLHYMSTYSSPFQVIIKMKKLEQELESIKHSRSYRFLKRSSKLLLKLRAIFKRG